MMDSWHDRPSEFMLELNRSGLRNVACDTHGCQVNVDSLVYFHKGAVWSIDYLKRVRTSRGLISLHPHKELRLPHYQGSIASNELDRALLPAAVVSGAHDLSSEAGEVSPTHRTHTLTTKRKPKWW